MFGTLKTFKDNFLNIESQLKNVSIVLNYGAKVWGLHIGKDVERVHTRFRKFILRVFSSNFMIFTERNGSFALVILKNIN